MRLECAFWPCFSGFWEATCLKNGDKLGIKNAILLILIEKGEHPKNAYISFRILIILGFGWFEIVEKIKKNDQKTTSTWESILGDVFSSTRRCANCRRDQKGRIQTIYLLYTPKIDSSGRQNGAHIAKKWVENHCKIDSGDSKCSFGE